MKDYQKLLNGPERISSQEMYDSAEKVMFDALREAMTLSNASQSKLVDIIYGFVRILNQLREELGMPARQLPEGYGGK